MLILTEHIDCYFILILKFAAKVETFKIQISLECRQIYDLGCYLTRLPCKGKRGDFKSNIMGRPPNLFALGGRPL